MLFWELQDVNEKLNGKGVYIDILRAKEDRVLLYVYRKERLERDLLKPGIPEFLRRYGYESSQLIDCLNRLKRRFKEYDCFPHEIGLFLSYPPEDVQGFIDHHARDFKLSGLWKVYGDEAEARALFARYAACTEEFCGKLMAGQRFEDLVVAV